MRKLFKKAAVVFGAVCFLVAVSPMGFKKAHAKDDTVEDCLDLNAALYNSFQEFKKDNPALEGEGLSLDATYQRVRALCKKDPKKTLEDLSWQASQIAENALRIGTFDNGSATSSERPIKSSAFTKLDGVVFPVN